MEQRKPKNKYPNDTKNKKQQKLNEDVKPCAVQSPQNVPAVPPTPTGDILTISEPVDLKYSKRKIVSNKEKYEQEIVNEDNEQMLAADFTKLLENPQSIGGYFQFSAEKQWFSGDSESEMTSKLFQEYFNLNLSLLNESILTIPFYKRLNLNEDLFNEREIEEMNRKAEKMEEKYRKNVEANRDNLKKFTGEVETINNNIIEILKEPKFPNEVHVQNDEDFQSDEVETPIEIVPEKPKVVEAKPQRNVQKPKIVQKMESPPPAPPPQTKQIIEEHEDDLDEILKNPSRLSEEKEIKPVVVVDTIDVSCERRSSPIKDPVKEEEPEDIQKWLDDVLND